MKAALLDGNGNLSIAEVPDPSDSDSVLVRVKAAGVCGTDLHFLDRLLKPDAYPFILGHEISGIVERAPGGLKGVRKGEHVAVYNMIGCGDCRYCSKGLVNL